MIKYNNNVDMYDFNLIACNLFYRNTHLPNFKDSAKANIENVECHLGTVITNWVTHLLQIIVDTTRMQP